ncbi:RluA family pseudouridine synthase [Marinicellulosiphila megalodicopiae]|uniref:RluA family pseudouridine synthase n=1 Tax=Marinicellulosiphila megalodicopiae TaxID=2724896 RepID=UPI003BB098FD
MTFDPTQLTVLPATSEPFELIHADDDFVVVYKPTKLLTVPGRHPDNNDCLVSRVQKQFPTAVVVHRLDYDTSGLVILPLNKPALSNISKQFQARTVHKQYTAIVDGIIKTDSDCIDMPIAKDPENPRCYKVCFESGKVSVTNFEVLERDLEHNKTRVLLKPVTGRSHQLRLHMLAMGHVILGDEFYADEARFKASSRLLLHSNFIEFSHPKTDKLIQFKFDVPF